MEIIKYKYTSAAQLRKSDQNISSCECLIGSWKHWGWYICLERIDWLNYGSIVGSIFVIGFESDLSVKIQ